MTTKPTKSELGDADTGLTIAEVLPFHGISRRLTYILLNPVSNRELLEQLSQFVGRTVRLRPPEDVNQCGLQGTLNRVDTERGHVWIENSVWDDEVRE